MKICHNSKILIKLICRYNHLAMQIKYEEVKSVRWQRLVDWKLAVEMVICFNWKTDLDGHFQAEGL